MDFKLISQGIFMFVTVLGFWGLMSALFHIVTIPTKKNATSYGEDDRSRNSDSDNIEDWPLLARVAKSLFSLANKGKELESNEDIELRLQRAGHPFYSASHYYSRQIINALIFGSVGLIFGAYFTSSMETLGSAIIVLITGFVMSIFGSSMPKNEVESNLQKRRDGLELDMASGLTRFMVQLRARSSFNIAAQNLAQSESKSLSDDEKASAITTLEGIKKENAERLGDILSGFGGNLFADLLNRFIMLRTGNMALGEIIEEIKRHYPYSISLDQFLSIVHGGLSGRYEMLPRLEDFSRQLKHERRQKRRERAAAARQKVAFATTLMLLPLILVFMMPMLRSFGSFF